MAHKITPEMQQCIDTCLECYRACSETATHCLELGGQHAQASHIRLLKDCSIICMASADFMLGASQFQSQVCQICADICERCAEDCERVGGDDQCAAVCRRCAEECRKMACTVARV
jgi:hypothetical protein